MCYNISMLAVSFLQWWYFRGWAIYFEGFRNRLRNMADFFCSARFASHSAKSPLTKLAKTAAHRAPLSLSLIACSHA